jgi:hypothetical protein
LQVLHSLTPFLTNIDLNKKWSGTPTATLLELLYNITEKFGQLHSEAISKLWVTAAEKPHNCSAILDFLLEKVVVGVAAGFAPLATTVCCTITAKAGPAAHNLLLVVPKAFLWYWKLSCGN